MWNTLLQDMKTKQSLKKDFADHKKKKMHITANTSDLYQSYRTIEWSRLEETFKIIMIGIINLTLPSPPLNHAPKCNIYKSFKYLQEWCLRHFPGQPVPMLDNPFSQEIFSNIQSNSPLTQPEAASSCPITS